MPESDAPKGRVCTRDVSRDLQGTPCGECGHAGLAHPGVHNPGVRACLLCELQVEVAQVQTSEARSLADRLDKERAKYAPDAARQLRIVAWVTRRLAETDLVQPDSWEPVAREIVDGVLARWVR